MSFLDRQAVDGSFAKYPLTWYQASGLFAAKAVSVAADRYTLLSPAEIRSDVGGKSLTQYSGQTLDLSLDASWDFGQAIGVWQAGHTYAEGQFVRPTAAWLTNGANNPRTDYVSLAMLFATVAAQVASASSAASTFDAFKAFSQASTGWWKTTAAPTSGAPQSLMLNRGRAIVVNKYAIQSVNDASADVRCFPKDWKLQGSNTATVTAAADADWVDLDTRSGQSDPGQDTYSAYYTFSNNVAYQYYRLRITDRNGTGAFVGVNELKLVRQPANVFKCTTAGQSGVTEPTWLITTEGSTTTTDGAAVWTVYKDSVVADHRAGLDFNVFLVWPVVGTTPKIVVSKNSTYPHGYTASNSRKVGGFPCICASYGTIAGHPLSGYLAGDIIPNGVWDLKNRCETQSNEGLAYDSEICAWGYIYTASQVTTGVPGSVYGGTIWSGVTWLDAVDAALAVKMRFPWDAEYQSMAALSNEGTSIAGGVDPTVAGGHSDTAGRRMVSKFAFEDMAGCKDHWLQDQSFQYDNSTWGYLALPGNKGSIYRQGTLGDTKEVAGGAFDAGVNAGSRSRNLSYARQSSAATIGFRLIARNQVR